MKQFIVSFEMATTKSSLDELSSKIGMQYASGSYDKGEKRDGKTAKQTVWKLFSRLHESAALEEHCQDIFKLLSNINVSKIEELQKDCDSYLNIGVLYDSYTCSIRIPNSILEQVNNYRLSININYYPTNFQES